MSKTIIFDFDGVISDTFNVCLTTKREFSPETTGEEYRYRFNGNYYKGRGRSVLGEADYDFFGRLEKNLLPNPPIEGIGQFLKEISAEYSMYIVSSTLSSVIKNYLDKYQINFFDEIIGPEKSTDKIERFEYILKEKNTNLENSVFVTDTLGDIIEANEIGLKTIAVTWGFHEKERLEKASPYKIVGSLDDLKKSIRETLS